MTEVLPLSPGAVAEWLPLWKAAGFFFATFMLEDVATVGAGLLLATGQISWPAAFAACFLGIWLGDAGLYALARFAGRGWFEGSSFRKYSAKVARSEQWFTRRGTMILIFSRMIPGARLPTYLAAGFRPPDFYDCRCRASCSSRRRRILLDVHRSLFGADFWKPSHPLAEQLQVSRLVDAWRWCWCVHPAAVAPSYFFRFRFP